MAQAHSPGLLERRGKKNYAQKKTWKKTILCNILCQVFPELYDLGLDPDSTVNLAGVEEYSEIVFELREMLRSGWRAELN